MSPRKRLPILPIDVIYPIVDLVALDFDIENLDLFVRSQRRLRREYYSKELLNLRIVSREFCRIVSPRLFRTLRVTHTVASITGFLTIIQSPRVRHCVQAVKYEYWDPGKQTISSSSTVSEWPPFVVLLFWGVFFLIGCLFCANTQNRTGTRLSNLLSLRSGGMRARRSGRC